MKLGDRMEHNLKEKPRKFNVADIEIRDYGKIFLDNDEMISLMSKNGGEVDITAKEWGFYLGSSLNGRMLNQGFKTALVIGVEYNKIFIMTVENEKVDDFKEYLSSHNDQRILCWLDEWIDTNK